MFNQRTKNGSFDKWIPPPKDGIQFRIIDSVESPESGFQSPPLWKNSPSPPTASRIQAIIKGQKELMDMVKKMPESNYELTLKDLVEQGDSHEEEDELILLQEKKIDHHGGGRNWINGGGGILENNNNNKGLLIKMMVFPIGMKKSKSSKKKKSLLMKSSSSSSAKISPKPDVGYFNKTSKNGDNNGWLRNMFSGGSDCSRSNSHSTSNGSINSNSSIRTRRGFYFFSCISCFKLQNDSKAPCFSC